MTNPLARDNGFDFSKIGAWTDRTTKNPNASRDACCEADRLLDAKAEHLTTNAKKAVRETCNVPLGVQGTSEAISGAAHLSNSVVAQLSLRWRVISDPHQWILQCRKGNPRPKASGWCNRSFCRTREALLRCIQENCDEIEPAALSAITALPAIHDEGGRT